MQIGSVNIDSKLVLAPMAGVTDLAFRTICRELGAGYTITEMVSAKALCYQDRKSRGLLKLDGALAGVLLEKLLAAGAQPPGFDMMGE